MNVTIKRAATARKGERADPDGKALVIELHPVLSISFDGGT